MFPYDPACGMLRLPKYQPARARGQPEMVAFRHALGAGSVTFRRLRRNTDVERYL